jgi:hypothetical protein
MHCIVHRIVRITILPSLHYPQSILQLDALLMLELPSCAICSPKAELVPIQLKLDMRAIVHRHPIASRTSRNGKNEHRSLLRQNYQPHQRAAPDLP